VKSVICCNERCLRHRSFGSRCGDLWCGEMSVGVLGVVVAVGGLGFNNVFVRIKCVSVARVDAYSDIDLLPHGSL